MRIPSTGMLVAALVLSGLSAAPLCAAELRVYSGGAPQETLKLLAPEFEKATGHRVAFTFAVVGAIQQRLEAGEKADVVLLPAPLIDALEKSGKIRPDSRSLLARVGIAVVVRADTPKPDVSTPEALRAALTQARSSPMPTRRPPPAAGISRGCSSNGTLPRRRSAGSLPRVQSAAARS